MTKQEFERIRKVTAFHEGAHAVTGEWGSPGSVASATIQPLFDCGASSAPGLTWGRVEFLEASWDPVNLVAMYLASLRGVSLVDDPDKWPRCFDGDYERADQYCWEFGVRRTDALAIADRRVWRDRKKVRLVAEALLEQPT